MPKVSIITPTKDRQHFLPMLWDCVRSQSFQDIEWLIHDGSNQVATFDWLVHDRVRYQCRPGDMTIGRASREWSLERRAGRAGRLTNG
jgi:hypothetical protein